MGAHRAYPVEGMANGRQSVVRADGATAGAADYAARAAAGRDAAARADFLAAEEPLGIRVGGTALTMTMRTPGDDLELAAGFLVGEAVIRSPADIAGIRLCDGTACGHGDHDGLGNIADVTLAPGVHVAPGARRNFLTTSACGFCGKTSIQDICVLPMQRWPPIDAVRAAVLAALPGRLRDAQRVFSPAPAACMPPGCSPPRAS